MPIEKTLFDPLPQNSVPRRRRDMPGRYHRSWAYQDTDKNYFLGTFTVPELPPHSSDQIYAIEPGDVGRPDLISYKMYKTPAYYWVLLWINGISDPFEGMYPGMAVRIPTLRRLAEYGIKA